MLELPGDEVLIGVDGGATEVKSHEVVVVERDRLASGDPPVLVPTLALGAGRASILYERARGFRPLPMPSQLLALERGKIQPSGIEGAQARLWVEAAARTILSVAEQAGRRRVRLGVCMPGLKTADGRGIAVMRSGPRIPDFLDRLEAMLTQSGLTLVRLVSRVSSDGEACAHGEEVDARGCLRGVDCAYYVGGGTGLAEALKIEGTIRGFDSLAGFVRKAWQMESTGGRNLEDLLSPGGMNAAYAAVSGKKLPLRHEELPEQRALRGDERAAEVLGDAAEAFAALVLDRMMALRRGFQGGSTLRAGFRGGDPDFRISPNTFLGRVVIGQRLGGIAADPQLRAVFREAAEEALARRIVATGDGALRKHYLEGTRLREDLLVASLLRASPALGAAAIELEVAAKDTAPKQRAPWDEA